MERFRRVAIVNRGEAAMRFVHAARESTDGDLVSIALHTAAERGAMFVREADEAVCLDDLGPASSGPAYLDLDRLERALVAGRAEAAWVGWGFVAERPEFADRCDRLGITFIGPSGDVMRLLGDKIAAKHLAASADVPLAPWSGGPVDTAGDAVVAARAVGFPLMVKASAGGGGRGIRRVDRPDDLADAFERARAEAAAAFGDPTVFLEQVVTDARHVEVQIIADDHGNVWAPGVRDCSIQRRNQKVVEESRSTALTPAQEAQLRDAAVRLARAAGYRNAGTVEFLHRPDDGSSAFLEVNTRLQVEHPVTEVTTGLDLVQLQLHVARGGRLDGEAPEPRGHAFEARLNAEDPDAGFAPAPGRIEVLDLPTGPGVRVDTGVAAGDEIAPEYDSMIAKVIAWGPDRPTARARLRRAISQTTVVVAGGMTNKSFLLDLVDRPEVVDGTLDTGWLDRLTAVDGHRSDRHADLALVVAAIDVHEAEGALERARFLSSAARGRPEAADAVGHDVELRWRGREHRVHVATGDLAGWYRLTLDGTAVDVVLDRSGDGLARLRVADRTHRVVSQSFRTEHLVEVDGVTHRFSRDDAGLVRAPAVSLVVAVDVEAGAEVRAGQRVAVVEAMKMETAVLAPTDGSVEEVLVTPNTQVEAGAPLLRITASRDEPRTEDAALGPLLRLPDAAGPDAAARHDVMRAMFLGFDVGSDAVTPGGHGPTAPEARARELDLLEVFADLCGLTRDRRQWDGDHGAEVRSPREHFNAYLRSFDADHEGLPAHFRERLAEALAHYGVTTLDRTPALESAVHRIHLAAQRREEQLASVVDLLERRADDCGPDHELGRLRDTLDHVVAASQSRYPAVGNLARSVRHRCIDRPLLDAAARTAETEMREALDALAADPDDFGLVDRLVGSSVPLLPMIAERDGMGGPVTVAAAFVEVLTRRYYRIRDLQETERHGSRRGFRLRRLLDARRRASRRPSFTARYRHRDRDVRVLAVAGGLDELDRVVADVLTLLVEEPHGETVVDLYLRTGAATSADHLAAAVGPALAAAGLPEQVTRVTAVATSEQPALILTWNRRGDEYEEDVAFRSLHPMIGRRLDLWRLENFRVTRLPSAPDTHVFHCVALEQETDERLVAVAEVRDFTPLRDAAGALIALPELERVLASCLDGIRRARAAHPRRRLEWNRVLLFVWPPVEISVDEVDTVARRLVPLTNGLGIEQVVVQGRLVDAATGTADDVAVRLGFQPARGLTFDITPPPTAPMQPLDDHTRKVLECRRRGTVHPSELVPVLTGEHGSFAEHDLDDQGRLGPVERPPGRNVAGVVIGIVSTPTTTHPEGMTRVVVFGDPTRSMGSIAEAECQRLLAAIDLAEERRLPIEWFALSAGARIAMDSGSENLDWVASVLRRIVEFTQAGGEINVVVTGINVGAQPYWNAEATMLMHTRGILVMTPESAMVLTGKQAIDFSGGVSADDNVGIGGHERVMGPNGQAQYWAPDLRGAVSVLFAHYDHAYVQPGEAGPRRATSSDPVERDVRGEPHDSTASRFTTVGEIFSEETNPGRKQPFDIRSVMRAVIDHDHPPSERWAEMAEAEGAVVYDAHLGGHPVCLLGIESRPLPRRGPVPADGPLQWAAGTLHPLSSKKAARAINAASGNRPVVVLANLSGFDGSPESLRRLQLEYGAEIGRAIVNFAGPIVVCVVSRYHGGAFVVFSGRLNDRMQVLAVEGAHASVIGGAPAAAVVFSREVDARTQADERLQRLERSLAAAPPHDRARLRAELATARAAVRNEVLGTVAAEFDAVHSVERAQRVGSVDRIVSAERLRPELVAAVERGLADRRP